MSNSVNVNDVHTLTEAILDGTLVCSRDWSAWGYNTMTDDDFIDSNADEEFFEEAKSMIIDFLTANNIELIGN